ncbi:MAG: NAD-dependent epimerase/dehydratase family protein, partial [Planctomycetota bacterium]
MSIAGRRVLVTGAGGFIGSHLAEQLVRASADVRAMVLYDSLGGRGWLGRRLRAAPRTRQVPRATRAYAWPPRGCTQCRLRLL